MKDYLQPDFYHFNDDSIKLVNYVVEKLHDQKITDVLDICAGCGVVGIELALKLDSVKRLDFIEIQPEFKDYIYTNTKYFIPKVQTNILIQNFSDSKRSQKEYDLIMANPPYFNKSEGRASSNNNKQICRTFMQSSIGELCQMLRGLKREDNHIYIIYPEGLDKMEEGIHLEMKVNHKVSIYSITN